MSKVILGIENIDNYKELFEGKRVGLITNPTGITSDFVSISYQVFIVFFILFYMKFHKQ